MKTNENQLNEIPALTGIRAFASFWVLLMHLYSPLLKNTLLFPFASAGFSGVTLFFILSGFILSYVYQDKFKNKNFTANYKDFILNRIARIYPLHLTCLLFIFSLYFFAGHNNDLSKFMYNIFLVQAWGFFGISEHSYNAAAWSISVEFFWYLLFPFIILFINNSKKIGLLALIVCFAFVSYNSSYNDYYFYFDPFFRFICWGNPNGYFYCGKSLGYYGVFFLMGACLYPFVKKFPEGKAWDYGCLFSFSLLFILFALPLNQQDVYYNTLFSLLSVIYGILIISLCKTTGVFQKIFGNRVVVYLGEISFALYMTHEWTMQIILVALPPYFHTPLKWLSVFFALLVAVFLYHFLEVPSRRVLRKLFKNPRPKQLKFAT